MKIIYDGDPLELGSRPPYSRPSNGSYCVTINDDKHNYLSDISINPSGKHVILHYFNGKEKQITLSKNDIVDISINRFPGKYSEELPPVGTLIHFNELLIVDNFVPGYIDYSKLTLVRDFRMLPHDARRISKLQTHDYSEFINQPDQVLVADDSLILRLFKPLRDDLKARGYFNLYNLLKFEGDKLKDKSYFWVICVTATEPLFVQYNKETSKFMVPQGYELPLASIIAFYPILRP